VISFTEIGKVTLLPLNQDSLFWCQSINVLPLILRAVLYSQRLPFSMWKDEPDRNGVLVRFYASVVAECQRPVPCRIFDGTPEVDNLEAFL